MFVASEPRYLLPAELICATAALDAASVATISAMAPHTARLYRLQNKQNQ